ncbi:GAF and ANTAR domain-containing protein [Kribbella sp. NPDC003557]|uniref:GAF and ANTAR domain-containing protein n=1 Tax=Kribbella sp. NPDC003557 TaxID=3154449 RepID=UPI00339EFE69
MSRLDHADGAADEPGKPDRVPGEDGGAVTDEAVRGSVGDVTGDQSAMRFSQLAVELHDAHGLADTAEAATDFAIRAVGCRYAGIALACSGGSFEVGAVTDPVVRLLYQAQADSGGGPLLTALGGTVTVAVHDVMTETRWPEWQARAAELEIGSVLHVPMVAHDRTIGVLSLFHPKPDGFDADDQAVAHILARHAAVAMESARTEANLEVAVDARQLIGEAMGILMERYGLDNDRAFAVLRRYSQDTNTKLRDVARFLIDTRGLPAGH